MKRLIFALSFIIGVLSFSNVAAQDYSVPQNTSVNQAVLTLSNGTKKYYNTSSVNSIDINGTHVTIPMLKQIVDIVPPEKRSIPQK